MKKILSHIGKYFQIYWYILIVASLTAYIIINWTRATSFVFFSKFDGINLLFIVWVVLLILPCIEKFEGFGVKVKSPFAIPLKKKADELVAQNNFSSIEEIKKTLATVTGKGMNDDEI
jgi:hypothetical protein